MVGNLASSEMMLQSLDIAGLGNALLLSEIFWAAIRGYVFDPGVVPQRHDACKQQTLAI
jgi:hypothetical protein